MAQIFVANIYRIGANDQVSPELQGFSPSNVKLRPVKGIVTAIGVRMYGIIQELPRGLVVDQIQYYVVETVLALQTLANA